MDTNVKLDEVLDLVEKLQDDVRSRKSGYLKSTTAYGELDAMGDLLSDLVHDIRRLA